ncbi:hypothetical protein LAY57_17065 [Argonema antarcticum A004/B2]|nr:hypothetical protein [Argonema antarcticum A004/B2]
MKRLTRTMNPTGFQTNNFKGQNQHLHQYVNYDCTQGKEKLFYFCRGK